MRSIIDSHSRDSFDIVFKVLLLLFCLAMLALFIYTSFFAKSTTSEKMFDILISSGGMSGAFYLYMRWRIIELLIAKGQEDPDSLGNTFVIKALSLIPKPRGIEKDV